MPLFTPFAVKDDLQPSPTKSKSMKIDHPLAERTFMLFRRDGTSFAVTVRLGAPFVGNTPPAHPEYRCAVQILGIGDDRVIAPWEKTLSSLSSTRLILSAKCWTIL